MEFPKKCKQAIALENEMVFGCKNCAFEECCEPYKRPFYLAYEQYRHLRSMGKKVSFYRLLLGEIRK